MPSTNQMRPRIAVIGLGFVGLPLARAFARRFAGTLGYDSDPRRIAELLAGRDRTLQCSAEQLEEPGLEFIAEAGGLAPADFYVITVPTPIDSAREPDLAPLRAAARDVGENLCRGDVVVLESTVYPGVTQGLLAPILEAASGLSAGVDFELGYSPERINPGDREHSLERVPKVVASSTVAGLELIARTYAAAIDAPIHRAPSIPVAEAAKVIENVQRDLNIALVNECAQVFDRIGLDTQQVLETAATKWNFHSYHPGLVGGHCIGVDPYYLSACAKEAGLNPRVILAGRRVNDSMGEFVHQKTLTLLRRCGMEPAGARVAVLGATYKAGVPDMRHSQIPALVRKLALCCAQVLVHDPLVQAAENGADCGLAFRSAEQIVSVDAVILAVPQEGLVEFCLGLCAQGARLVLDLSGRVDPERLPPGTEYWRL